MDKLLLLLILSSLALAQVSPTLLPESTVTYTARDNTDEWSGTAPVKTLEFTLNPDDIESSTLSISLEPDEFDSGNFVRDANARRAVFESAEFPEIRFDAAQVSSDNSSLEEGESQTLSMTGDLTMHGVTRDLALDLEVTRTTNTLNATGGFSVLLSDYDMNRPEFFGNVVADEVELVFNIATELP